MLVANAFSISLYELGSGPIQTHEHATRKYIFLSTICLYMFPQSHYLFTHEVAARAGK